MKNRNSFLILDFYSVLQADGVYEPDYTNYDLEFSTFTNSQSYIQQTMMGKVLLSNLDLFKKCRTT